MTGGKLVGSGVPAIGRMGRRMFLGGSAALAGLASWPSGAAASEPLSAELRAALDAEVSGKLTAGGALVAVRNGRVLADYFWGQAALPFEVPVGPRTLFHMGSNGKLVTAVALMQLLGPTGVQLDDPVGQHLPELPDSFAGVTIDQLLSHTSGLADYTDTMENWDRPQSRKSIEEAVGAAPALFQPGEAWSYSNTNYMVLGWLIEHLAGRSYADYIQLRLFEPAGMPTARADASEHIIAGRAEPYVVTDEGEITHAVRMNDSLSRAPDGGVLMSSLDIGPWRHALASDQLVSAQDRARIHTPARLKTGRRVPYGYGVFVEQQGGRPLHWHSGGVPGFGSFWKTWPERDLSIVLMTNAEVHSPRGVDLQRMMDIMAEAMSASGPGLASGEAGTDERSRVLFELVSGQKEASAARAHFAEELQFPTAGVPRRVPGLVSLRPLESWLPGQGASEGELVRYEVVHGRGRGEIVVGWTPDNRIYWM